jgi:3-phenylpropionate/trans-cinnamate dioxygenase ferredoxin reductase subunit
MVDRNVDVLLVGGGVASAAAALELVTGGFGGSVLLAGRESDPPYERPPLTKGYLRGEQQRADAQFPEPGWFDDSPVELLTRTTVSALDTRARTATLSTQETVAYERALVATGAMVRRLQVEGAQLEGIHYLRAFGNADSIRAGLEGAQRVVCVGGSYIGCEAAASLAALGLAVTIVMLEDEPLERTAGRRFGAHVREVFARHGVEFVPGDQVARFEGAERVERVVTEGGAELPADLVVCGVGVTPDVALARAAGLELGDTGGVRCDETLSTSDPRVWAAGDICEYPSPAHDGRRIRVEHVEHAKAQGAHAARSIMGSDEPFAEVPYFYSDLADWLSFESVGPAYEWDEERVSGAVDEGRFGIWYLEGGRVRGALSAGGELDLDRARELILSGEPLPAGERE